MKAKSTCGEVIGRLCAVLAPSKAMATPNSKSSRLRLICYNYHIFYILIRLFRRLTTPRSAMPFLESEVRSQESGVRSQESGVRSQESGVRSQESGARSQEPGVRSQEPGVRSQQSEIKNGQFAYATVGRERPSRFTQLLISPESGFDRGFRPCCTSENGSSRDDGSG